VRTFNLLVAAFALVQVVRYARRGLFFLAPAVQVLPLEDEPDRSAHRLRLGAALEELGFVLLGVACERAALGAFSSEADAYVSPGRAAFADVLEEDATRRARVRFFTPFPDGAAVLTAGFEKRAVLSPRLEAGGMPDAPLEDLLAAHEVAVRRFAARHGPPQVAPELAARLAAARAYYAGVGRSELRRGNALAFALLLFALVLFASSVKILVATR